jgi:hypothetical protein
MRNIVAKIPCVHTAELRQMVHAIYEARASLTTKRAPADFVPASQAGSHREPA